MVSIVVTKTPKKEPPFPAAFEVDNREASNRVDRSHSVSKEDDCSHKRESLTDRKRSDFFSFHLPCRPLAECTGCVRPSAIVPANADADGVTT
jgi:hypothetical protein